MADAAKNGPPLEAVITAYVSRELVTKPSLLPLKADMPLFDSGILDSLSILRLTLFLEEKFGVVVEADELVRENFARIGAICAFVRRRLAS